MPRSESKDVVAHWHKLIGNFSTSSQEYYVAVEAALKRWELPVVKMRLEVRNEGGLLDARRDYLRIGGNEHEFHICAAPFGTGFFFSSWVTRKQPRLVLLYYLGFVALAFFIWKYSLEAVQHAYQTTTSLVGSMVLAVGANPILIAVLAFCVTLWFVAMLARGGTFEPEAAMLTIPLVGALYKWAFAPDTYYRIDTMLMFQSAVHSAMLEVIDSLLQRKGLRALSEVERKPVFRELVFGGSEGFGSGDGGSPRWPIAPAPVPADVAGVAQVAGV